MTLPGPLNDNDFAATEAIFTHKNTSKFWINGVESHGVQQWITIDSVSFQGLAVIIYDPSTAIQRFDQNDIISFEMEIEYTDMDVDPSNKATMTVDVVGVIGAPETTTEVDTAIAAAATAAGENFTVTDE